MVKKIPRGWRSEKSKPKRTGDVLIMPKKLADGFKKLDDELTKEE